MIVIPILALFLASCADGLLYNEAKPNVSVEILSQPDTVLVGDSVVFAAKVNTALIKDYYWYVKGNTYSQKTTHKDAFLETGVYTAVFTAVDSLGDSLSNKVNITVVSAPVCNNFNITQFQGATLFKWNCSDSNFLGRLTYRFSCSLCGVKNALLESENSALDTLLTDSSLHIGYTIPRELEISLTATNYYGFKAKIDTVWSAP